jgi:hypothetical protein
MRHSKLLLKNLKGRDILGQLQIGGSVYLELKEGHEVAHCIHLA